MKKYLSTFISVLSAFVYVNAAVADYNVVPRPRSVAVLDTAKCFTLNADTKIYCDDSAGALCGNARLLSDYLRPILGKQIEIVSRPVTGNVIILTDTLNDSNHEAYRISVSQSAIVIDGASSAGNFYGCQTLRKSISLPSDSVHDFPVATIYDYPEYGYRGAHLDVARHFFPVDSVKSYIDMMALHNMNRFHWHLSDDQGWRIEIKSRPRLTEIGSMRRETIVLHTDSFDHTPHGGFYTQDEARDIVRYAAQRHIQIIPEIDIPGHSHATLAAYPEVGCTGGPYEVHTRWNGTIETLCPGTDETFALLQDVFDEIIDIFTYEFVNIGGDECPKTRWKECAKCQARIAELGLVGDSVRSAEDLLQGYVTKRVSEYITAKGRRVIGWDEILECDVPDNVAILSWRGTEGALQAARRGHDTVMCPTQYCYFDYFQTENWQQEPLAGGGMLPIKQVYSFKPAKGMTPEEAKHLLGVQCNLWTEATDCQAVVENRALPRMAAISEVQWRDDQRDYAEFFSRLQQLRRHYDKIGYRYAPYIFQ